MSEITTMLERCLDMTKQLTEMNMKAMIDIRFGSEFTYKFFNMDESPSGTKKKQSPSQIKRNFERKVNFERYKATGNIEVKEDIKKKMEGNELKVKVLARPTDAETKTDHIETETIGTNTG